MRSLLSLLIATGLFGPAISAEPAITIERLMTDGWQIAGYTGGFDNRTSLILFRPPDKTHLVQCSVLHDVTRTPRVNLNCYELR